MDFLAKLGAANTNGEFGIGQNCAINQIWLLFLHTTGFVDLLIPKNIKARGLDIWQFGRGFWGVLYIWGFIFGAKSSLTRGCFMFGCFIFGVFTPPVQTQTLS